MLKKYEESLIDKGIQHLVNESNAFEFLKEEEDSYILSNLKEKYNG